jgi:alpha-beta hydrolase superfamily lysophospholipase
VFVVGHSMGGLIALGYAQRNPGAISGLVAVSPGLALSMPVPAAERVLAGAVAHILPHLAINTRLSPDHLTHDADIVAAYKADPVRARKITLRFWAEFDGAMADVSAHPEAVTVPTLFMPAGNDFICSTSHTVAFYEKVAATDKRLIVWDGMYHEVLNEPNNREVLEVMEQWISARRRS